MTEKEKLEIDIMELELLKIQIEIMLKIKSTHNYIEKSEKLLKKMNETIDYYQGILSTLN